VGETPYHLAFLFGEHQLGMLMITSSARFLTFYAAFAQSGYVPPSLPESSSRATGWKMVERATPTLWLKRQTALVRMWMLPADNCSHSIADAKGGHNDGHYSRQACTACGAEQCVECVKIWRHASGPGKLCAKCNRQCCPECGSCLRREVCVI
jgi:hypothetical protein